MAGYVLSTRDAKDIDDIDNEIAELRKHQAAIRAIVGAYNAGPIDDQINDIIAELERDRDYVDSGQAFFDARRESYGARAAA